MQKNPLIPILQCPKLNQVQAKNVEDSSLDEKEEQTANEDLYQKLHDISTEIPNVGENIGIATENKDLVTSAATRRQKRIALRLSTYNRNVNKRLRLAGKAYWKST